MNVVEEPGRNGGAHYFNTSWDSSVLSRGLKYAIQIVAESTNGSLSLSEMRFVSDSGEPGEFHLSVTAFLVMRFN